MAFHEVILSMISVIIPAYNSAAYILESIRSVRTQRLGSDAEIIVVDDGSSDDTKAIVEGLAKEDARIRLLCQDHRFAASARNLGISESHGEWIYLLDSDDVSLEGALDSLMDAAMRTGAKAVFGLTSDFISPELTDAQKAGLKPRPQPYPGILPGASLIKKEVFDAVGAFDTSLSAAETVDWMVRFRESGFSSVDVPETVLGRRLHLNNTGRLRKAAEAASYAMIIRRRLASKK